MTTSAHSIPLAPRGDFTGAFSAEHETRAHSSRSRFDKWLAALDRYAERYAALTLEGKAINPFF
ncbi:MAG TPA: hypothetical protein VJM34_15190 [Novosphingobium sp.]|nr:hypothetical protein [Novosphingobium sp.]